MGKDSKTNLEKISESVYRVNGSTPSGGCYSMAFYLNDKESCAKEDATEVRILEFDENDEVISEIFGVTKPKRQKMDKGEVLWQFTLKNLKRK